MSERTKKVLARTLEGAIIVVLAIIGWQVFEYFSGPKTYLPEPVVIDHSLTTAEGAIEPITISIPKLGVEADVEHVGRDSAGRMGIPVEFDNVAWYREGYAPGEVGNSVIAGHLDDGAGDPAVFFNLERLEIGDSVLVDGEEGRLHYKVVGKEKLPYDAPDTSGIFGESDVPRLNLITCDGTWIANQRNYSERLIVYTELVERE